MTAIFQSLVKSLKDGFNNLKTLQTELKEDFKEDEVRITACKDVYKSSKTLISAVTSDLSGGISADSLSKLIVNFDGNFDDFATAFDKAFNSDTSENHINMLENFTKEKFGCEVFNIGSNLKNKGRDYVELYNSSKTLITSLIQDCNSKDCAKLFTNFDNNWDKWASAIDKIFNRGSDQSQTNILETFAIDRFGANVFNTGSIIKNETPNILNAINIFKAGIASYSGSYRNPQEAIAKIKIGVDNIVKATEQLAKSANNIVKLIQSNGSMQNAHGWDGLDALSKLSSNKLVAGTQNILKGASSVVKGATQIGAVVNEASNFAGALKKGDIKGTIEEGKQIVDNVRSVFKGEQFKIVSKVKDGNKIDEGSQKNNSNDSSKEESNGDSYVCSGAIMKCSFGSSSAKLTIYPDRTVYLNNQPMANVTDHISLYHIAAFGKCKTTAFPPTGSATAAAHGKLTPMPCVPGTNSNWINGKKDVLIKGNESLLKSSYCKCKWGGIITITFDGQK